MDRPASQARSPLTIYGSYPTGPLAAAQRRDDLHVRPEGERAAHGRLRHLPPTGEAPGHLTLGHLTSLGSVVLPATPASACLCLSAGQLAEDEHDVWERSRSVAEHAAALAALVDEMLPIGDHLHVTVDV